MNELEVKRNLENVGKPLENIV